MQTSSRDLRNSGAEITPSAGNCTLGCGLICGQIGSSICTLAGFAACAADPALELACNLIIGGVCTLATGTLCYEACKSYCACPAGTQDCSSGCCGSCQSCVTGQCVDACSGSAVCINNGCTVFGSAGTEPCWTGSCDLKLGYCCENTLCCSASNGWYCCPNQSTGQNCCCEFEDCTNCICLKGPATEELLSPTRMQNS